MDQKVQRRPRLAAIVFNSFAGLGLKAAGTGFSVADLMRPGKLAQTGLDAGAPLLEAASDVMGASTLIPDLIQIGCLGLAWLLVVLAFFILAIQMFVVLIEFKLTTLAGFVLIPFGLFGKSAFMAEKVLGNVVSSGIKVLVLAVITGIGSTLFDTFVRDFGDALPTIEDAMAGVLAALTLLGLGIFGPSIANGLVSGGPQLGAGSAVGTGLAAAGAVGAGVAGIGIAARGAMALGAGAAGLARGGAAAVGAAQAAYGMGAMGRQGASAVAGGLSSVARAATSPLARSVEATTKAFRDSYAQGVKGGFEASGGTVGQGSASGVQTPSAKTPPQWARDTVRWIIGSTESGTGAERQVHILIKPTANQLSTNLVINTDRRTYHIEVQALPSTYMASVSWRYPLDEMKALEVKAERVREQMPVASGLTPETLNFQYSLEGAKVPWRPVRAFDDGRQVFIELPASIATTDLPPLFLLDADGKAELVNYRVSHRFIIVDRLFSTAEMRLGEKSRQKAVRIRFTGGPRS